MLPWFAGAGTTSEKQFYTYTDTTAQPNVVYYYQIEDVSLDGNRQTLTRGIRLKGHIGAAGKAYLSHGVKSKRPMSSSNNRGYFRDKICLN